MALGQGDERFPLECLHRQGRARRILPSHRRIPTRQDSDGLLLNQLIGKAWAGGLQGGKGQVDIAAAQQLLQIGRAAFRQLEIHVGVLLPKHGNDQGHDLHGSRDADAQAKPSRMLLTDLPKLAVQLGVGRQNPLRRVQILLPGVGQAHGAGAPVKDGKTGLLLQLPEHLAQGGLADEEPFCRRRDAPALGNGFHILGLLEIHNFRPRICQISTRIIICGLLLV